MAVSVRAERSEDRAAVRAVVEAAFGRAAEADLVDRLLADGDAAVALVAEADGAVIGHILFAPLKAPFPALALALVSVLPARQRQGIGSALIRAGLADAARAGWRAVFVLGEPATYRRFGFDAALAAGFASPYAGPYLMALALNGPLPATSGEIEHAPAFAAVAWGAHEPDSVRWGVCADAWRATVVVEPDSGFEVSGLEGAVAGPLVKRA